MLKYLLTDGKNVPRGRPMNGQIASRPQFLVAAYLDTV
jgi:hypothetical protein